MSSRVCQLPLIAAALIAAVAASVLGGCGDSHTRVTTGTYAGESGANAPYLDVGPLVYEVQLARELNPYNTEDSVYLQGLTAAQRKLAPGEEFFGVFVQVYNNTSKALPAASGVTIRDTQGNIYEPLTAGEANQFIYRSGTVPGGGRLPEPDSVAAAGPTQGALLLYKIQSVSLDNRPLELKIADPSNESQTASAELDV